MTSEKAVCPIVWFLSAAWDRVLSTQTLDRQVESDLGVLLLLSSAFRQVIDDLAFSNV